MSDHLYGCVFWSCLSLQKEAGVSCPSKLVQALFTLFCCVCVLHAFLHRMLSSLPVSPCQVRFPYRHRHLPRLTHIPCHPTDYQTSDQNQWPQHVMPTWCAVANSVSPPDGAAQCESTRQITHNTHNVVAFSTARWAVSYVNTVDWIWLTFAHVCLVSQAGTC